MAATNKPSVADRTRPIAAGAAVVGAYFLADTAVFVLGDEALALWFTAAAFWRRRATANVS